MRTITLLFLLFACISGKKSYFCRTLVVPSTRRRHARPCQAIEERNRLRQGGGFTRGVDRLPQVREASHHPGKAVAHAEDRTGHRHGQGR